MKNQKRLATLLLLVLMLSLAACGSKKESPESDASTPQESTDAPAGETITLKLAGTKAATSLQAEGLNWLAEQVYEKSGGTIKVDNYLASSLGGQDEIAEGLLLGTIELGYLTTAEWGKFSPKLNLVSAPFFTFANEQEALDFMNSEYCQEYYDLLHEETGITMRGISLDGARQIWTDVELSSIEDFKGVALRVPDVPIYVDSFDALGFITTIVPWGDCYTAVQTGVVSGLEIDYNSFAGAGMDRIMPYCMITNHSVATNSFAIHDSVLEKLSEEQKAVLFECIDEATDYINNLYFEKLNETVEAIKANGVTFTEATAEQSAEMSSIVKPVVEDYLINNCQFTADEMDAFFAELAK